MSVHARDISRTLGWFLVLALLGSIPGIVRAQNRGGDETKYRGLLGPTSKKVKQEGGKTYIYAGPRRSDPNTPGAPWYDFTGSVIPTDKLQFGIGKDTIRAIDDPLFVSPDDSRLLALGRNVYRQAEAAKTNDELRVLGFVVEGEARAYPVGLLDHHELVNDVFKGKPVTVGW